MAAADDERLDADGATDPLPDGEHEPPSGRTTETGDRAMRPNIDRIADKVKGLLRSDG